MFKHKELEYVLLPYLEIGMYEPKSGTSNEVVVVNFYVKEEEVLDDLKTFIDYMPLKKIVDVTTSDYSDSEGRYSVYIELFLDGNVWEEIMRIVLELGMVSGLENWKVKLYKKESKDIKISDVTDMFAKTK